ncbi:MAG: hypothetical protein ACW98K_13730 [Candidatus Kariarchaeaceae archaeon]
MESITVFRIFTLSVFLLFVTSLFIPIAQITINNVAPGSDLYLEFICVFCQYGGVDSTTGESFAILRFTPFDFYFTWIPILAMIGLSSISVFKAFPKLGLANKISDRLAVNSLWLLAIVGLLFRGLLSLMLKWKLDYYESSYPDNQVLGELSWGMGALLIGSILATSTAMIGFIEFLYDPESSSEGEPAGSKVIS